MPKSISQTMQDELEPILHDSTERDESDEIEEAKSSKIRRKLTSEDGSFTWTKDPESSSNVQSHYSTLQSRSHSSTRSLSKFEYEQSLLNKTSVLQRVGFS